MCTCVLPALLPARAIPSPTLLPARLSLHQVLHQVTSVDSLFQLQRAACHAKAAETKGHQRDARGTPGRTSDPLAMDIVPRLPRKSGRDQGTPVGHQRDARGTPGRTSDPLAMDIAPRLPRKSGGDQGTPEGRQRDARAYIRPLSNGRVIRSLDHDLVVLTQTPISGNVHMVVRDSGISPCITHVHPAGSLGTRDAPAVTSHLLEDLALA